LLHPLSVSPRFGRALERNSVLSEKSVHESRKRRRSDAEQPLGKVCKDAIDAEGR
jgi:hypothetical protein